MLDLLVTDGEVVLADGPTLAVHVGIADGRVVGLYDHRDRPPARDTLDARGKVVLPGLLDAHVHPGVYEDLGDDLEHITRFAALGGITSMVAFHRPQATYAEAIPAAKQVFAAHSHLDFGFILGVTQRHQIADVGYAVEQGVNGFKFYLGYCGHEDRFSAGFPFTDTHLIEVMEALAALPSDPLLCVHCENAAISAHYQSKLANETEHTLAHYDRIHPVISEADAAVRVSLLGHQLGIRTCIVHVSAGTTAELLAEVPWTGSDRVVLETCLHYLAVDVDDPAGLRAVVRPPVRTADEVDRLWEQVLTGNLDTIGSDNCGNRVDEKIHMDVRTCRLGFGEMGLTLPLLLHEGHHRRGMPLSQIVAMTSRNIAAAHRLLPRKGTLLPGADADLVVVDLELEQTVDPARLKSRPEGSIYAGRSLRGWPVATVIGGRIVAADGHMTGELGHARFLRTTND